MEGDYELVDHRTTPKPFEMAAANEVFETIQEFVVKKFRLRSYKFMTGDIRDSIDKIILLLKKNSVEMGKFFLAFVSK